MAGGRNAPRILRRRLQGHLYVTHKLVVLLSIINSILSNSVCLGTYLSHGLCRWQTPQWTLMYPLRATKLQYINYKQAENSNFMLKYKDSLMCWILEHSILNSNNNKRLKKKKSNSHKNTDTVVFLQHYSLNITAFLKMTLTSINNFTELLINVWCYLLVHEFGQLCYPFVYVIWGALHFHYVKCIKCS